MTISDERRSHWDDPKMRAPYDYHDMSDSLPYPFEPVEGMFKDKRVLEIGPGRGRQYQRLRIRVKSYAICDITLKALLEPVFDGVVNKYLLRSYADDFELRFGIVHFWYVLHHVKPDEVPSFFAFVVRHLVPGGYALFNSPQTGNAREWYTDDGIGTSYLTAEYLHSCCTSDFSEVESRTQDERSSGYLFIARK